MSENDQAPLWGLEHISGNPQDDIFDGYQRDIINEEQGQYLFNTQFSSEPHNAIAHREFQHQVWEHQLDNDDQPPLSFLQNISGGSRKRGKYREFDHKNKYQRNTNAIKRKHGLRGKKYNYVRHYAKNKGIPRSEQEAKQNYDRAMNRANGRKQSKSKHTLSRSTPYTKHQNHSNHGAMDAAKNRKPSKSKHTLSRPTPYTKRHKHSNHNHVYTTGQSVQYFKWQFGGSSNKWYDYDAATSKYIEQQFKMNPSQTFTVGIKSRKYRIKLSTMQQQSISTSKYRTIKRVAVY